MITLLRFFMMCGVLVLAVPWGASAQQETVALRDFNRAYVASGSKSVFAVMSAARPLFPEEQTFVGTHRTSVSCHKRP